MSLLERQRIATLREQNLSLDDAGDHDDTVTITTGSTARGTGCPGGSASGSEPADAHPHRAELLPWRRLLGGAQ
ncbi:hypothetical protein [Pseudonocardia parietis]|uniref:Uncharacterized protein n=1 Tax=Pseudonocardia parietis TaxID=570936 RepID=A0ABS4VUB5_9PSEU|nr:hypothetical protein [Pseudonocardia parietis]MBP2367533.1 hypothetical protein [Pseudonocardia parietis]